MHVLTPEDRRLSNFEPGPFENRPSRCRWHGGGWSFADYSNASEAVRLLSRGKAASCGSGGGSEIGRELGGLRASGEGAVAGSRGAAVGRGASVIGFVSSSVAAITGAAARTVSAAGESAGEPVAAAAGAAVSSARAEAPVVGVVTVVAVTGVDAVSAQAAATCWPRPQLNLAAAKRCCVGLLFGDLFSGLPAAAVATAVAAAAAPAVQAAELTAPNCGTGIQKIAIDPHTSRRSCWIHGN